MDKPLPELVIEPLVENSIKKKVTSKLKNRKKVNEMSPTPGKGHKHNESHAIVHRTREIEIATDMYKLMFDEGKNEKEIAELFDCSIQQVRKYLNLELQDAQDGLIDIRGKASVIGYNRLEKYGIAPAIKYIQDMTAKGEFDPRGIETLLKVIKLQAELLSPKSSLNIASHTGDIFMNNGSDMYNEVVEMMRSDEDYEPPFTINAEDVELTDFQIPKMVEDA